MKQILIDRLISESVISKLNGKSIPGFIQKAIDEVCEMVAKEAAEKNLTEDEAFTAACISLITVFKTLESLKDGLKGKCDVLNINYKGETLTYKFD